jgi:CubicO group peptidase (beta-lactamase class C family)
MEELMTHTAGFTYGPFGSTPVDRLYNTKRILGASSLHDMIERLAGIPLLYQPGTKWVYSVSMDIQGYIVEKLSGKSLPEFMQERIFGPLRMKDSGFFVAKEKRARFATGYGGSITPEGVSGEGVGPRADYVSQPGAAMGGSGMVATAADYARFAQMMLNRGELDGVRILSPESVALMTTNHLAAILRTGEFSIAGQSMRAGHGWGYDMAVFDNPVAAHDVVGKGTFYWEGLADTWFWVDPTNDIVFVGMTQRTAGAKPPMSRLSRGPVYEALVDPKK